MGHPLMELGCNATPGEVMARMPTLAGHGITQQSPQPTLDRSSIHIPIGLDDNNNIGDCVPVSIANGIRTVAAIRGFNLIIPTNRVVDLYARQGYVRGNKATDIGSNYGAVLGDTYRHGFNTGNPQFLVDTPFASLDPQNRNMVALMAEKVGFVPMAVDLAMSDQFTDPWDISTPASAGDPTPGSWGKHGLAFFDYPEGLEDTDLVDLETWGMMKKATWRWVRSRVLEAYMVIARPLLIPANDPALGVDVERLMADNDLFAAS